MIFSEKLQLLRKSKGFTQEEFAEKLNVSRQAVAKWEAGQAYPDIANLIQNHSNLTSYERSEVIILAISSGVFRGFSSHQRMVAFQKPASLMENSKLYCS